MNNIKGLLREGLLLGGLLSEGFDKSADTQYQNVEFRRVKNVKTYITYHFDLNGYEYYVDIFTTKESSLPKGTYDVLFGFTGQKGASDTANVGNGHLKYVLYTTARIMDIECKEKKIKFFHFEGFPTQKELETNPMGTTKRSRVYNAFFDAYYGTKVMIETGRYTVLMMNKVYPELFQLPNSKERKNYHLLGQMLTYINNGNPGLNIWDELDVMENEFGDEYSISTDEIQNKDYGGLDLDIDADETNNKFSIQYRKFDTGESNSGEFNDFMGMINFIQTNLMSKQHATTNQ